MATQPKIVEPPEVDSDAPAAETLSIAKPVRFSLDKFKSKRAAAIANVETLLTELPILSLAEAKDFVRLHPNEEECWSPELCFVNIPVKGQKRDTLHLIDEELAIRHLPSASCAKSPRATSTTPTTRVPLQRASRQSTSGRR